MRERRRLCRDALLGLVPRPRAAVRGRRRTELVRVRLRAHSIRRMLVQRCNAVYVWVRRRWAAVVCARARDA